MRENKLPFEVMYVYDQKILANKCELTLMRAKRTNELRQQDTKAFARLHSLLQAAVEGDTAVSGSQMAASSEQSLEVLRETLRALVNSLPEARVFKRKLASLAETAQMVSEQRLPSAEQLGELAEFCHLYGLVHAEFLKERYSPQPSEATIWPLATRLGYSSMF